RASTSRCFALCGAGMYSSLETIWVGTGEGNDAVSAGCSSLNCSSVRNFMSFLPGSKWARCHLDVQQRGCVAAEDRPAFDVVEPRRSFDHTDRVSLAHIRRIIRAHQNVIGAVLIDEIVELMAGVDERVEIDPLQIGGRHAVELL